MLIHPDTLRSSRGRSRRFMGIRANAYIFVHIVGLKDVVHLDAEAKRNETWDLRAICLGLELGVLAGIKSFV